MAAANYSRWRCCRPNARIKAWPAWWRSTSGLTNWGSSTKASTKPSRCGASTSAAAYLYRVRWQVELIFKQWKSVLRLQILPSTNENRVQCEVWARLLAAVLGFVWHQHAGAACQSLHQREISFLKLAKQLQQHGQ